MPRPASLMRRRPRMVFFKALAQKFPATWCTRRMGMGCPGQQFGKNRPWNVKGKRRMPHYCLIIYIYTHISIDTYNISTTNTWMICCFFWWHIVVAASKAVGFLLSILLGNFFRNLSLKLGLVQGGSPFISWQISLGCQLKPKGWVSLTLVVTKPWVRHPKWKIFGSCTREKHL